MFIGALGLGRFADRVGRRRAFLVNLGIYSVFTLLGAFATNAAMLIATRFLAGIGIGARSEEHTSELQSRFDLVCRLLREKKNRGCIPTKSFLHSSELAHEIQGAAALGIKTDGVQIDWPAVLKRKESVVNQLWRGTEFLLKKNKVAVFQGEGVIESEHKVVVKNTGQAINAKNLVVATGSRPKSLLGLNMDGDRVINSDHAVSLDRMPKSIVIVGAGAVGTEFACVYNGYGAKVTLVEFLPTLLPLEDSDVGQQLAKVLGKRGITG